MYIVAICLLLLVLIGVAMFLWMRSIGAEDVQPISRAHNFSDFNKLYPSVASIPKAVAPRAAQRPQVAAAVSPATKEDKEPDYSHMVAKPLMDEYEMKFFYFLRNALPDLLIFPQVAFSAIIQPKDGLTKSEHARVLGFIKNRRFDFMVCDPRTFGVLGLIEWDGRAHETQTQARKDAKRDKLAEAAGYRVIHFLGGGIQPQSRLRICSYKIFQLFHGKGISSPVSQTAQPTSHAIKISVG